LESNYAIAISIATLSDWLKNLAPVFQRMRSKSKTNRPLNKLRVTPGNFFPERSSKALKLMRADFDKRHDVRHASRMLNSISVTKGPFGLHPSP